MEFNTEIKNLIGPFLEIFDFEKTEDFSGIIRYEHRKITISFLYDYARSYEVDVNFQFTDDTNPFTFKEVQWLFDQEEEFSYTAIQVVNSENLIKWINDVLVFLKDHLNDIFENLSGFKKELTRLRDNRVEEYNARKQKKMLIDNADEAWQKKDYKSLIDIVETNYDVFSKTYFKKLEIAKREFTKSQE